MTSRFPKDFAKPQIFVGTRREVLLGSALAVAGGAAFVLKPRRKEILLGSAKIEDLVPKAFAGWQFVTSSGLVLPPEDQLSALLYSQLLTRAYSRPDGTSIMLLIAYAGTQDGVVQVHRPEICYPAGGYRLTRNVDQVIELPAGRRIPSRFIVAESDLRREQLIYWTRLGNQFPRRWSEQRLAVFEQNLVGIIPDAVLVRISTNAAENAEAMMNTFAADLYRSVGDRMKQVLVGPL